MGVCDRRGVPSASMIHHFTAIDIWCVTSRVIIIIIVIKTSIEMSCTKCYEWCRDNVHVVGIAI